MTYVDGYVLPMPKKNLPAYRRMAMLGGKLWRKHGALEYFECVGDDMKCKFGQPFPKVIKARAGEVVIFSFVVFKSKAHRDRVNGRVMKDPKLSAMMEGQPMPFDVKRMLYGGFKTLVEA